MRKIKISTNGSSGSIKKKPAKTKAVGPFCPNCGSYVHVKEEKGIFNDWFCSICNVVFTFRIKGETVVYKSGGIRINVATVPAKFSNNIIKAPSKIGFIEKDLNEIFTISADQDAFMDLLNDENKRIGFSKFLDKNSIKYKGIKNPGKDKPGKI